MTYQDNSEDQASFHVCNRRDGDWSGGQRTAKMPFTEEFDRSGAVLALVLRRSLGQRPGDLPVSVLHFRVDFGAHQNDKGAQPKPQKQNDRRSE